MAVMARYFYAALPLRVLLLALLSSCGSAGQLPQAKPLPSSCLAQFEQDPLEPAEHMALCDHIAASYPESLRVHVDRFIVWEHYGKDLEACQKLFDLEKTMATLTFTPDDEEDFDFSLEEICKKQVAND